MDPQLLKKEGISSDPRRRHEPGTDGQQPAGYPAQYDP
jgi:hypothetical protein